MRAFQAAKGAPPRRLVAFSGEVGTGSREESASKLKLGTWSVLISEPTRSPMAAMDYYAQQLINGLVLGSVYGLIAIGYTMVYGIVGMINFAHGDIFMIGGFIALITFLVLVSFGLTAVPVVLLDRKSVV